MKIPEPGSYSVEFNDTDMEWNEAIREAGRVLTIRVYENGKIEKFGYGFKNVRKIIDDIKKASSFKDVLKKFKEWALMNNADLIMWISNRDIPAVDLIAAGDIGKWVIGRWIVKIVYPSIGGIGVMLIQPSKRIMIYLPPIVNKRMKVKIPKYLAENLRGITEFEEIEVE